MGPVATINLGALRHNLSIIRLLAPSAKVICVIKADAYGHGMIEVASVLKEADMLAVARVSEGVQLRQAGISAAVMVLEGFSEAAEIELAVKYDLQMVIHHLDQLQILQSSNDHGQLHTWLKIDTGMHRLGIDADQAKVAYQQLQALHKAQQAPGLMTHFANADNVTDASTQRQIQLFDQVGKRCYGEQTLANSAAILAWPESHRDWVRPGLMLYGCSPLQGMTAEQHHLQPVMTLQSQLMVINHLKQGDCLGYGSTWCCPEDMPVGIIAIGYGDGYPRHAPSGTPVLINGQRARLIGRVSMDMISIDLRGIDAQSGDMATLWGEGLPVEEIAAAAGTISYELLCGVTARVDHQYTDGEKTA